MITEVHTAGPAANRKECLATLCSGGSAERRTKGGRGNLLTLMSQLDELNNVGRGLPSRQRDTLGGSHDH